MDTIEKYYIYKETKNGNQIKDKNTVKQNRIFDVVIQSKSIDRAHIPDSLAKHPEPVVSQ